MRRDAGLLGEVTDGDCQEPRDGWFSDGGVIAHQSSEHEVEAGVQAWAVVERQIQCGADIVAVHVGIVGQAASSTTVARSASDSITTCQPLHRVWRAQSESASGPISSMNEWYASTRPVMVRSRSGSGCAIDGAVIAAPPLRSAAHAAAR